MVRGGGPCQVSCEPASPDSGVPVTPTLAPSVFFPPSEGLSPGTSITMTEAAPADFGAVGGVILYTTDGTLPSLGASSTFVYSGPVVLCAATTFTVVATAPGYADSPVLIVQYPLLAGNDPLFDRDAGGSCEAGDATPLDSDASVALDSSSGG